MKQVYFFIFFALFNLCFAYNCNITADCNNGVCNNKTCACSKGYVDRSNISCIYQQKEKLTAFLLSFLIGTTGADWFYLSCGNGGYIAGGIFKLLTGVTGIILPCVLCCLGFSKSRSNESKAIGFILVTLIIIVCSVANGMVSILFFFFFFFI